jgi:RND family efflux transporter MFP subunit
MRKIIGIVLAAVLILAGAMLLRNRGLSAAQAPTAKPLAYAVETVLPRTRTVRQTRTFLAKLESLNSAEISSRLSGVILRTLVSEGQRVRQGDSLVKIDDRDTRSNLEALGVALASARKDLAYKASLHGRNLKLYKAGGLSREKLDASGVARAAAASAVKGLEQKIASLKVQLDYLDLKAPFDGIVGAVFMRRGDLAVPGRPILSLNSLRRKLVFSFAPRREAIKVGQEVRLRGRRIGSVAALYDDARSGLTAAEASLEQSLDGPNNSYVTIQVVTREMTGCTVPLRALLHGRRGTRIMVYRDKRFTPLAVTVKAQDKAYALIEPCVDSPAAVAAEAKLSLLPIHGALRIISGKQDAKQLD